MTDWLEVSLYDIADYINGRATKPTELIGNGLPVVKIAELNHGIGDSTDRVPRELVLPKHLVHEGDLLFAWSGSVGIYRYRGPEAALNQHIFRVEARANVDQHFLEYLLRSQIPRFEGFVADKRTTMGHVTIRDLQRAFVTIPPLDEQRAVAGILGALDDKIELNRRMSETLEAMARALFRSWFVDFDPVRAKAEGRDPGVPQPIADLFPSRFEDSELGEIPAGWRIAPLDSEFELTMGQSPPGETYNETGDGLPFYQGRVDFGFRFPTRRVFCSAATRVAKRDDVLVSVRAPVGDINMAWEDCAIGRGVAAVRHKSRSRIYAFEVMRSLSSVFARFNAEGTVFGSIGKKDFHAISLLMPPLETVTAFDRVAAPLDRRIEVGERESQTLGRIRDALLPRLISGEIRVPEAERLLEAAPA